jgi:hypothetical protein
MRLAPLARTSLTLAAICAFGAAEAGAQKSKFEDSWFWGVKGGGVAFNTRRVQDAAAPGAGAEWLITRTHAALNLSFMQYFFETQAAIDDPTNPTVTRTVDLKNMRNLGASLLVFPKSYGTIRPYAGLGWNFNLIQQAYASGGFASAAQRDSVQARVQQARTGVIPVFTAGAQGQYRRVSLFVQGGVSPGRKTFVFDTGSWYTFEGGIRYNVGTASERPN